MPDMRDDRVDAGFMGAQGSGVASSAAVSLAASASFGSTQQSASAVESWLVQKLRQDWSSCEVGPQLTRDKLSEAVTSFSHLETPIKVRLLLACLSMRREDVDACKLPIVELMATAERDNDEWVKIAGGIVRQHLFATQDDVGNDSFLHEQLQRATDIVLQAVQAPKDRTDVLVIEDFFCHENAFLNASVRPELTVQPAAHFTLVETAQHARNEDALSPEKTASARQQRPTPHRPQIPRPGAPGSSASSISGSSSASLTATSHVAKTLPPPSKKNMSELSSEIRRKADAGRFKRQRNRISMIDIDEVKQIESEKAQKAEEQRKKLKATKEGKQNSGTAQASGTVGGEASTVSSAATEKSGSTLSGDDMMATQDSHHSEREDSQSAVERDRDVLVPAFRGQDGTQALLNAAFHSTQDVMNEVVAQQHHFGSRGGHQETDHLESLHHAARGFEPEDVQSVQNASYNYAFGYPAHLGDHAAEPYRHDEASNYSGGFDDNESPHSSSEQRSAQHRNNGGNDFLDGPGDYWR
ncbi:hypothetical protein ATCC90586_006844 [Pythium insidiosum]|nr:hypothetical protein ATCC90586_006844 [Pythium insidiosum]